MSFSANPLTSPRLLIQKHWRCCRPAGWEASSLPRSSKWPRRSHGESDLADPTDQNLPIRIQRGNLGTHRYLAKRPTPAAPLLHGQAGKRDGPKTPRLDILSVWSTGKRLRRIHPFGPRVAAAPATSPALLIPKAKLYVPPNVPRSVTVIARSRLCRAKRYGKAACRARQDLFHNLPPC
jgi:hypothetical protein